jgi:hypothetical protein
MTTKDEKKLQFIIAILLACTFLMNHQIMVLKKRVTALESPSIAISSTIGAR